jgi:hypothetical protein
MGSYAIAEVKFPYRLLEAALPWKERPPDRERKGGDGREEEKMVKEERD